ncbi:MAG: adenylyltransferase/cytidyltransferase family protein [Anaerolineales bacterium]|nr:adenylyltransferase/cytidyltransferase family protein [Anaerolineales bacterium]
MDNVLTLNTAIQYRQKHKLAGNTLVFTNGIFDLFHIGHLDYLERARKLGDVLIVGLNSDASTQELKGKNRPIVPQDQRARLLASLRIVDAVVIFEETTASDLLRALNPDVYVKGGDYAAKDWPEKQTALALGCRVELLPYLEGYSSSQLIESILNRNHNGAVD